MSVLRPQISSTPDANRRRPTAPRSVGLALVITCLGGCATQKQTARIEEARFARETTLARSPLIGSTTGDVHPGEQVGPPLPFYLARATSTSTPRPGDPAPSDPSVRPAQAPDAGGPGATDPDSGRLPPEVMRDDTANPAGTTPESIPEAAPAQAIDLASALRLADHQNPTIGESRVLILGALAQRQAAYGLLLPTLNAGTNYHDHVGVLQRGNGTILPVSEQSLYVGSGAQAVGAQSPVIPGVNIFSPLTDAIFEPLAAQQRVRAAQANAASTANFTLLDVARLYLALVGAQAQYDARRVTTQEADEITRSVVSFAATGQGRRSDADRADADRRLFQTEILRAEELRAVTSIELARLLNVDPSARLQPMTLLQPITLIDAGAPVEDLIRTALTRRPDLATRQAVVAEASYQVRREQARPLLPTIWVSFSGGAFGGGSNLVPPLLSSFAGRTDFDARAYWTLLNFGVGNVALVRQRRALEGQAVAESTRTINEIRNQVKTERSLALALRNRVEVAEIRLRSAQDGYRQDRARLRETLARPIEALDSLRLLADARIALIEAITRANQNQFALFVALGAPPPL